MPIIVPKVPENSDELHALVEAARRECWESSDQLRQAAPQLRVMLREGLREAGWGFFEATTAAWLVSNPLVVAARFQEDSARQVLRSFQNFNEKIVGHRSKSAAAQGKRFKVT